MLVLATPTLVMAMDTNMVVDSDIMVEYFQLKINTNALQQCTFSLKYILSEK